MLEALLTPLGKPSYIVYHSWMCRNSVATASEAIVDVHNINQVPAFITKDGSEIRELLAHRNSCVRNQSLAEARLPPGAATAPHYHPLTEELYYILEGSGWMQVAGETRDVGPGDAIAIPPVRTHQIANTGSDPLKFLCCCAGVRASGHGLGLPAHVDRSQKPGLFRKAGLLFIVTRSVSEGYRLFLVDGSGYDDPLPAFCGEF